MKRRKFFKTAGLTLVGAVVAPQILAEVGKDTISADIAAGADTSIEAILYISTNGTWKSVGCIKELRMDEVNEAAKRMAEHAEKLLFEGL